MESLHIVTVKYLSATNHRGSRIKLTSDRFGTSVTLGRDYTKNADQQAIDYLVSQGQNVIGRGWDCNDKFQIVIAPAKDTHRFIDIYQPKVRG